MAHTDKGRVGVDTRSNVKPDPWHQLPHIIDSGRHCQRQIHPRNHQRNK